MANDDAQTDLKKRARRRLVGAAALALFAAIVLPMIMDPEPEPLGEDIQVRIPAEVGDNVAARSIEVPVAPSVTEPVAPAVTDAPATPRPATDKPAVPADLAPSATQAPETAVEKPAPKAVDKPTAKPAAKPDEAERVAAILTGQAEAAKPAKDDAGPGFVVQIGAFANAASAAALSEKIRQTGFKAYTRKVGSTTRVRVGPYPNREDAEAAAAKLAGRGFKGVVMPRG